MIVKVSDLNVNFVKPFKKEAKKIEKHQFQIRIISYI